MRRQGQSGYILLPVVLMISLIAVIAFTLNNQSAMDTDISFGHAEAELAEHVAHAGLAHATWGVQNSSCAGDMSMTSVPFGQTGAGSYTATVTTAGGTTTAYPNLAADQDSWFRSDDITNNNGGTTSTHHLRMETGNLEYAVVRFDLSSLPAGAQINSAVARFYIDEGKGHPEGPVTVHRVTADWIEASATWETMGNKFDSSILGSIPAQPATGNIWVEVNLTSQVQAWVNRGESNYGIMLIPTGEGTHAQYISREGAANQQPHLDVVVGTGPASPMTISTTGKLTGNPTSANDITRTLSRTNVPAYQPGSYRVLQPGAASGIDAEIWDQNPNNNYGNSAETWVSSASNDTTRSLLRFNMGKIPAGVRILGATLSLHRQSGSGATLPVSAHRIRNSWSENSVTWNRRKTGTNWDTAGGDFDSTSVATTPVGPVNQRYEWNITPLVQGWVDSSYPNNGVALVAAMAGMTGERFYTSDHADSSLWPSLSITYACECGMACVAPQGSGKVALVGNYIGFFPDPRDLEREAIFESWGYDVDIHDDSAISFPFIGLLANIGNYDVVYVSETVASADVNTKLTNVSIGVINEEPKIYGDLELANSHNELVGSTIDITDNDHYITAPFAPGSLSIYDADMEVLTVSGAQAPGLQTLAEFSGSGTVTVLDQGAQLTGGGSAAGLRVLLPIGEQNDSNFNWDYLNANGRLLVQRAIQWGAGENSAATGPIVHWKLDETSGTTAVDSVGGHDGTLTNGPSWTTGQDGGALDFDGSNDYVDLTSDAELDDVFDGGSTVTAWVYADSWGESDHGRILDKSSQTSGDRDGWMIAVNGDNPSVEFAQGFSGGRGYWRSQAGTFNLNGWVHVAVVYDSSSDTNDPVIYLDGIAQSPMVEITPSGTIRSDASITLRMGNHAQSTSRTFDGKIDDARIYDRMLDPAEISVIAGGGGGGGPPPSGSCDSTFRDEFNLEQYDQNDGTLSWATNWEETGETTDPEADDIRIKNDVSDFQLMVRDDGQTVWREADLTGAASATLSFDYRRENLSGSGDYVAIEVSYNGGSSWTELDRFTGTADDVSYASTSYELDAVSLSANTRIRFLTPGSGMDNSNKVWFDNVQILCSP